MPGHLVHRESPEEYFRELVETALAHQRLTTRELTPFYLVDLLTAFVRPDSSQTSHVDEPLGLRFVRALQTGGAERRRELRRVADLSLFVAGFFPDSLARSMVGLDYYAQLGGLAYGSLVRHGDPTLAAVFSELAEKFPAFVDVLGEISEHTGSTSNRDLLRLYERWLHTGSRRVGDLLTARGILPSAGQSRRLQ